jgi:hypothetical protein
MRMRAHASARANPVAVLRTGATRNWTPIGDVALNPEQTLRAA